MDEQLKKAKAGDIVAYKSKATEDYYNRNNPEPEHEVRYLHRLCAVENDVIEMRNGVFFCNKENFDAAYNLLHFFIVSSQLRDKLPQENDVHMILPYQNDSLIVNLTDDDVKKLSISFPLKKYFDNRIDTSENAVFAWYNVKLNWTADNFGPLAVPKGYGFVMGDNRSNSLDSRYIGFIKLSDIKGVKL